MVYWDKPDLFVWQYVEGWNETPPIELDDASVMRMTSVEAADYWMTGSRYRQRSRYNTWARPDNTGGNDKLLEWVNLSVWFPGTHAAPFTVAPRAHWLLYPEICYVCKGPVVDSHEVTAKVKARILALERRMVVCWRSWIANVLGVWQCDIKTIC